MRKNGVAEVLFSATRNGVLGVLFRDADRWWFLSELAGALGTSPSSLQREVDALASAGVLERRADGRRMYYRANANGSLFSELASIVRKTMGIPAEVQAALQPLARRISLALVYGSVAAGTDRSDSDVDVLIVADGLTLEEVYKRLARVERKLGRKVNPTIYTTDEFRRARSSKKSFVEKVMSRERIVMIGSEDAVSGAR